MDSKLTSKSGSPAAMRTAKRYTNSNRPSVIHVDIPPESEERRSTTAPQRNNNPPAMITEIAMMKMAPKMNFTGCIRLVPVMPDFSACRCTIYTNTT